MREEKKKDNTNEKKGVSFEALSSLDAPVSFWKGIPFGLQHVMAMFVANLAPIFLVASAANMSAEQSATIIQAGLLVAGLGTCLQLYGVWLIGSRLPMVTGISFTYVAAAMSIAQNQGYGAVAGAVVLGWLLLVLVQPNSRKVVVSSWVFCIRFEFRESKIGNILFSEGQKIIQLRLVFNKLARK